MFSPEEPAQSTPEKTCPLTRRSALSTLGLASIVLAASASPAVAFLSSGKSPKVSVGTSGTKPAPATVGRIDFTDLPPEWVQNNRAALIDYTRYLCALNLKQVSPKQVIEAHAKQKGSVWNSLPPKAWWNRMGYTLRVVDRIALEMGVREVEIISAYRAPSYNALCAGAKTGSWHQANVATDVKFPVKAAQVTAASRHLRDLGLFKGGVGGYWNFTHIDTRGQNINW